MIVEWLVPVAVFWMLGAMYLGGAPIEIRGGGGVRQLGGLLVSMAIYLLAWAVLRGALQTITGPVLSIVIAVVIASALLPWICRLGFIVLGVRIRSAGEGGHGGHGHGSPETYPA